MAHARPPGVALLQLFWQFLRLGTVAFGGLGAALALLDRRMGRQLGWVTDADIAAALAYTKPLPGSTVVQVVTFLGHRLRGWPGAVLASVAFVAPSFVLMAGAAAGVATLPSGPLLEGALTGIHAAVVGLLAAAMWQLARSQARGRALGLALAGGFAAGLVVNAALVVVGAGALGASASRWQARHG